MRAPEELRTKRLRLRRVDDADLDDLVRMHADPRVMKTLGGLQDEARTREGLAKMRAHWADHGFGLYILRARDDGRFVGRCGLRHTEVDGEQEVEVGWSIVADEWGKGYATEAAREQVGLAFGELGFENIVSFTLPFNTASRRVMEKLGFGYEKECWYADLPHVLYRLHAIDGAPELT